MDRLYFKTTRRFDSAGKQRARLSKLCGIDDTLNPQIGQLFQQWVIPQHGPFAKAFEQPILHLAGGSLGIGQAQNVLGLHSAQQQARDPVCQNPCLARARIGGEPCRRIGARGLHLPFVGVVMRAHVRFSGWVSAVRSHSPNRAR